MVLPAPLHIRQANLADPNLGFAWDEWRVKQYYSGDPLDRWSRLHALSLRAATAFGIAIAEWIYHRFAALAQDPTAINFIEAAWAGNIHIAYCEYTETTDDEWRGPVRGPLAMTITLVNDMLFCLDEDPEPANRTLWLHNLARHVLPSADRFEAWYDRTLAELERWYARAAGSAAADGDELDMFATAPAGQGDPVPRELFEHLVPYDPALAPAWLDKFLQRLDPTQNPYLRPAAALASFDDPPPRPYRYP